jgi:hypothetical protein
VRFEAEILFEPVQGFNQALSASCFSKPTEMALKRTQICELSTENVELPAEDMSILARIIARIIHTQLRANPSAPKRLPSGTEQPGTTNS